MKRAGFTMIELIFVIVILGILAAVALPKFVGVSTQANIGKAKAYIGTLNRTVGPALWAKSISDGDNGSVSAVTAANITAQIETPDIGESSNKLAAFALTDAVCCDVNTTVPAVGAAFASCTNGAAGDTFLLGSTTYSVWCAQSDSSTAPRFWLTDGTNIVGK